ncbi:MAG: PVC-type heme-binding CxxCH protein, partial [Chthoniobacteraceae bacterium]
MKFPASLLSLAVASPLFAADFPATYNSEPGNPSPIPAAEALAKITLPAGLQATLFASEPEVQNPIAMCFDARGRLWIAENYTYAERALRFDMNLRDRILIFDDTDGDGRADSRRVFTENLQMLTSIARDHGGVWAMCPPQLVFIPDADGDDVPDAPPRVVLDGFTVAKDNYHNFANGLKWGPDGWLYGRCGASCPGEVGAPGTPPEQRVPVRGGMWRFHPQRGIFEALTHGTTNPWGHDWDEFGELFFVNTVNGHLWHAFPGAHFTRPHTLDPMPHSYAQIDTHADHYHFDVGKGWTASRDGASNDFGGGHSHQGAMIYQGGNWPAEYRGKLFTLNLHGRRMNTELLERHGSGYVAKHERDFALFGDPWFRGIDLASGPDGGVFVLDWSDTGECHDSTGVHRTSGRIFKITAAGKSPDAAGPGESLTELRAMWTRHLAGSADGMREGLRHADEHLRTWAIRLLTDEWPLDLADGRRPARPEAAPPEDLLAEFSRMAREDESGLVRLTLASTLQRLPHSQRAALAAPLLARAGDADDHNLPLLVWHGLAPLGESDPGALAKLAGTAKWPTVRRFIARRLATDIGKNPAPLNALLTLAVAEPAAFQSDVLGGMHEAFTGWRKAPQPAA